MKQFLKIAFSLLLTVVLLSDCKKDPPFIPEKGSIESEEKLTLDINDRTYSSPAVERIFSEKDLIATRNGEPLSLESQIANQILYEIESEVPFIEEFLLDHGEPYWEYVYSNRNVEIFNVSIPIIKDDEITGLFSFLQADEGSVSFHFNTVEFNTVILPHDPSFTTSYVYYSLQKLVAISGRELTDEISFREGCCTGLSVPTYATIQGSSWAFSLNSGSLCTCYNWFDNTLGGAGSNGLINASCCDNNGTPQVEDGGLYEAGINGTSSTNFPSFNNWLIYYTFWLEYWSTEVGGTGVPFITTGTNNNQNSVQVLKLINNEQKLLGWLIEYFIKPNFGNPAPIDYVNFVAVNPHVSGEIYKYLQGYYADVAVVEQHAVDLVELLVNTPSLVLHNLEVQHILTFDPSLTNVIESFLDNHPNDVTALQVVHDFISLEYCSPTAGVLCIDYSSNLNSIYSLYSSLNQTQYDWLHSNGIVTVLGGVTATTHEIVLDFLLTNTVLSQSEKNERIKMFLNSLINQPALNISVSVLQDLLTSSVIAEDFIYFIWVISNDLMELDELLESYEDFNPDFAPEEGIGDVEEIFNGIDILSSHPIDPTIGITPGTQQASTPYRHPYMPQGNPPVIAPDMGFGVNGNTSLLTSDIYITDPPLFVYEGTNNLLDESNDDLFDRMENLADWLTDDDSPAEDLVKNTFIPRFKNSVGEDLESLTLNELVEDTNEMKNFVKAFGDRLNEELKTQPGNIDINNVSFLELLNSIRPKFNKGYTNYFVNGLKVMINDTEQTNVYTQSFDINQSTGEWTGVFLVEIFDHFGLDDTDLVRFQNKPLGTGKGFASWWILQHVRNHEPFRTKIRIIYTIEGNVND